ncbi:hypothetical protein [Mangrovibrevibacter kandeliae]|uniref:hypothetical protein n=1 Tax=Mangrovibrevibacter kandeliae TaxID=2968473 RepID=UPI0021188A70|nr:MULTISPECIES: hypothetical protein [unclassified Aurantimonas]MCQ8781929.1 hypothetical protein [Aurantimonas sp. CSK15Z-1]MCW4115413.1 hypothetical protein [Aurantimonas sp. MSK8Z-1]
MQTKLLLAGAAVLAMTAAASAQVVPGSGGTFYNGPATHQDRDVPAANGARTSVGSTIVPSSGGTFYNGPSKPRSTSFSSDGTYAAPRLNGSSDQPTQMVPGSDSF